MSLTLIDLPASKKKDPIQQKEEESAAILSRLERMQGVCIVLDERGISLTSTEFAQMMESYQDRGESVILVLGGAYGLNEAVRQRADDVLRFSAMTFPHELCRLIALEQLYRAKQIQQGSGYHHH